MDRFGKDIRFSKTGDQKYPYRTTVEVCMSDKFLADENQPYRTSKII